MKWTWLPFKKKRKLVFIENKNKNKLEILLLILLGTFLVLGLDVISISNWDTGE